MMKKIVTLVFIAVFTLTTEASADETVIKQISDKEYEYNFSDDPLHSGAFAPNDAILRIRGKGFRTTLIKPRTSFVRELVRDIEEM